jgi:sugar phosphate isomerase/epimerase
VTDLIFNSVTNRNFDLVDLIAHYQRHGIRRMALWREKIDPVGVAETRKRLDDAGIAVTNICGWLNRGKSSVTLRDKLQSVEIAAELGGSCMTLLVPGLEGFGGSLEDCRKVAFEQAARVLEHGRAHGIRIALEPVHPSRVQALTCVNTIKQAIAWCEALGDGIGVEIDVHNVWWDPDLAEQIGRAAKRKLIAGVQLCDVMRGNSDLREVPGQGVVDLAYFVRLLKDAGYCGPYEIELIGQHLWEREPDAYTAGIIAACDPLVA